jgi:hypothetical protein
MLVEEEDDEERARVSPQDMKVARTPAALLSTLPLVLIV